MAPSLDCRTASLFCREGIRESEWEDNVGSFNGNLQEGIQEGGVFSYILPVDDDDVITLLIQKEDNLQMEIREYLDSFEGKGAEMQSRIHMIGWMLDVHAYFGFNALTAFLSVSYFDRFLSKHINSRGKIWLLQLVAVGCISLAAKLEETEVPLLLDLQVGELQHVFESCTIQRMELLILSTLNWQMSSVTPFSYIDYLIHKIGFLDESPQTLIARAEELILYTCRDARFLVYSSSVVAVASLICACEEEVPLQATRLKQALLSLWPVKEVKASECAQLMEETLRADPFWTSTLNKVVSRNSSSAPQSPMGVLEAACFSSDSSDRTVTTTSTTNYISRNVHIRSSISTKNIPHPMATPVASSIKCPELAASSVVAPPLPPHPSSKKRKLSEHHSYSNNKPPYHAPANGHR